MKLSLKKKEKVKIKEEKNGGKQPAGRTAERQGVKPA